MHEVNKSGQIYPCCWHADDWSGNRRTLQRQFLRGGYERQTHAVVYASRGVGVEDIGSIGEVDRAV